MQTTYAGSERRLQKRVRMNCTVVYRLNEPVSARFLMQGEDIQAKMIDISQNGMAMITDHDIPIDTVLSMRFTLLKVKKELVTFSQPTEITGQVRSNIAIDSDNHRLGISFTKMKHLSLN